MAQVKEHPITIKDLQKIGIPIHSAKDYLPREWAHVKSVSIEKVQAILSKFKGSMAEIVAQSRQENL